MNRTKSTFTGCILGLGLVLATGQSAYATGGVWDASWTPSDWTRGTTPGSLYAEWNSFADNNPSQPGIQATNPDIANFGGGTYQLSELTTTGFITGGNIYSFAAATAFELTVGNVAGGPRDVYLRLGSVGNFDSTLNQAFTNFELNGITGTYQELFNEVGDFGGQESVEVEALISWTNVPSASLFTLTWDAIGPHVSLDQLSLDVGAPVPVPAAAYLMASGLIGLAAMARRKQRAV
ncbi:MAG: VPLPA-CTERM sorting domain-containing protein [Nitrospira sp.]|nr:VPLPA-CTERM sorting domain-containing protein [Nitrospira sp.]